MKHSQAILLAILAISCSTPTAEPNICEDPTGSYRGTVDWTTGNCRVADGTIDFQIWKDGALWRVHAPTWGVGYALVQTSAESCSVQIGIDGMDSSGNTTDYSFQLVQDEIGNVSSLLGKVEVTSPTGLNNCSHNFEMTSMTWLPENN